MPFSTNMIATDADGNEVCRFDGQSKPGHPLARIKERYGIEISRALYFRMSDVAAGRTAPDVMSAVWFGKAKGNGYYARVY